MEMGTHKKKKKLETKAKEWLCNLIFFSYFRKILIPVQISIRCDRVFKADICNWEAWSDGC